MKLYTEEQVLKMLEKSQYTGLTADFLILAAPSVQLPTDEEIEKANPFVFGSKHLGTRDMDIWELGAKWMRDKIKGGNK
jgi:hypothetical protein